MKHLFATTSLVAAIASASLASSAAFAASDTPPALNEQVIVSSMGEAVTSDHLLAPALFAVFVIASLTLGPTLCASDAQLKTDIVRVGTAANGLPLYHFRYIGQSQVFEGVLAQDVLSYKPEAVKSIGDGYLGVDYGMLGMEMRAVN